ncbi:NAD(P)-binding protein [Byssothecium circinans]|uniref:NAD(P)-binding protein n=1 Tax=Byssothecium circinans TaxID=147558 RepID=A0A6A5UD85_9PLEO|nr:NAD(P)-binding protein [Byssothecium circinans]
MGMLLGAPLQRLVGHFVPASLPPSGTFDGQTVLVVGATTGIGLAAAVHFATLGASVIITSRVASRGDAAKQHIEEAAGPSRKGGILCLELDLESYDSCNSFMAKLKSSLPDPAALDVAILNGGIVNSHWEESAAGWERTIQINTIGTTLVGLLLLGWMRGARGLRSSPAHLTFLSSREHLYPDLDQLVKWSQQKDGILRQVCSKDNWPGGFWDAEPNYAISKLLVMYTIEEISRLALGPDGDPLVIVNSVCPGMVKTDIGRHIASRSWFYALGVWMTLLITAKSADSGARICVTAALKPKENHGEFFNYWMTTDQYHRQAATIIGSEKARALQTQVWKEVINELKANVPELQAGLDGI